MKPPLRLFKFDIMVNEKGLIDAEFYDSAPKGIRRLWWISNDIGEDEPGPWYGVLKRSETDDGAFDWRDVELPKTFAAYLGAMVQHKLEAQL